MILEKHNPVAERAAKRRQQWEAAAKQSNFWTHKRFDVLDAFLLIVGLNSILLLILALH